MSPPVGSEMVSTGPAGLSYSLHFLPDPPRLHGLLRESKKQRRTSSACIDECLPREMLEIILGKLDKATLCTARLVNRSFCAAASAIMYSLTLSSCSQALSLERFPCLGHVTVHHIGDHCSLAELDPRLRALITRVKLSPCVDCVTLSDLPGMPKLRELDIDVGAQVHGAEVLRRLTNLEVLKVGFCTLPVAMTITTTTWLTSLVIGLVTGPGEGWEAVVFSWVQHATNLRRLQALKISVSYLALPLIGDLTGLTGLTWWGGHPRVSDMEDTYSIAPLSSLSRLRSLEIGPPISAGDLAVACSLGGGSLMKLRLRVSRQASADWVRLLARQTALTRLAVDGKQLCNLRHMGGLRMELLQSLEFSDLNTVDAEGLDALQRATSLTELSIGTFIEQPDVDISHALGRLTQLHSLELYLQGNGTNTKVLNFRSALSPLTALTKLYIFCGHLENADVRALLSLTSLQDLYLDDCHLTDDVVPELGVLTNLRTLMFRSCGVTSLAPAANILNPLREARGWPPVDYLCLDI